MQFSKKPIIVGLSVLVLIGAIAASAYFFNFDKKETRTLYDPIDIGGELNVNTKTYDAYGTYENTPQKYFINYPAATTIREIVDFDTYCTMLSYKNGYVVIASLKDDQRAQESGRALNSCATINGLGSGYVPAQEMVMVGFDEFQAAGYEYKETMYPNEQRDRAFFFLFNDDIVIRYGFANKSGEPVSEEEFKETMTTIKIMMLTFELAK